MVAGVGRSRVGDAFWFTRDSARTADSQFGQGYLVGLPFRQSHLVDNAPQSNFLLLLFCYRYFLFLARRRLPNRCRQLVTSWRYTHHYLTLIGTAFSHHITIGIVNDNLTS